MNPLRWIDRHEAIAALSDECSQKQWGKSLAENEIRDVLLDMDPVEIIHCEQCENYSAEEEKCLAWGATALPDEFCSRASKEYVPIKWNELRGKTGRGK